MNSRQFQELQEAYLNVYQLDEAGRLHTASAQQVGFARIRAGESGGGGYGRVRSDNEIEKEKGGKEFLDRIANAKKRMKEEVDIYDVILSHLLDEGYASTEEAATAIMVNMSEEWRESIVEEYKDLPADKMIRKAGVKQFKHGMSVGSGASSNPKIPAQVGKISAIASLHDPERAKAQSKMKKD
jgi:hypothetical protein